MKTTVHYFDLNLNQPEDARAYAEMCDRIVANSVGRGCKMAATAFPNCKTEKRQNGDFEIVEIETEYLFNNQWNTTTQRLFDWYEEVIFNGYGHEVKHRKRGHWLEISQEMAEARANTLRCGYCGAYYGPLHAEPPKGGFCLNCLDSPYLKEDDLFMLRLRPVTYKSQMGPLTEHEKAVLMALYVYRQTTGTDSRAKAKRDSQRKAVIKKHAKNEAANNTEKAGMLWIWDKGFDLDNVIYYDHSNRFCFGWRNPVSESVAARILDVISEFPYNYTIKCVDGRNLEN